MCGNSELFYQIWTNDFIKTRFSSFRFVKQICKTDLYLFIHLFIILGIFHYFDSTSRHLEHIRPAGPDQKPPYFDLSNLKH